MGLIKDKPDKWSRISDRIIQVNFVVKGLFYN